MHLGHAQAVILIGHCTYLAITEGVARTYDHDIEATPPDYVLVYIPTHPFGRLNAARIPFAVGDFIDRIHFRSPLPVGVPSAEVANSYAGRRGRLHDGPTGRHDRNTGC
jgi:hypothetical protein